MSAAVQIVEVGPRDGFQGIRPFIPTATKIAYIRRLWDAGLRRIEVGSFVSAAALPQLRDTAEVLSACTELAGLRPQVLVPSQRRADAAIAAGAQHLVFVVSVSDAHNLNNVRQTGAKSVAEYLSIVARMPRHVRMRLDLATAFDCPFEGRVAPEATLTLLEKLLDAGIAAEICLCDTTGRADPTHVGGLIAAARDRFPQVSGWAFHGHDTYGLGLANVYAAYTSGIRVFDSSFAGLGGCPFAPGATGNVATEDVAWMFDRMGVTTGIKIDSLVAVARDGACLDGAIPGGRVRQAFSFTGSSDQDANTREAT